MERNMIRVTAITENIARVVCTQSDYDTVKDPSFLIEELPEYDGPSVMKAVNPMGSQLVLSQGEEDFLYQTGFSFTPKEIYRYTFEGDKPVIVTKKTVDGERSFVENAATVKVGDAYEASISFALQDNEAIYGLGQHEDGKYNYRNTKEYLYHNNMKIPMPVIFSSRGYGLLFDCTSMMTYEESGNLMTFTLDAVDQIDYYVIRGARFDDLVAGVRLLTGRAVMLPRWIYGYVQSKERYKTQEEILETARRFDAERIPLGCIVLDWLSWEEGKWGNKIFDKSRFPDAKAMVDQLHKQGVAFMISIWPNCREGCENHEDFAKKGKLLCNFSTYDAFDEEARDMYWKQCEKELFAAGTDAWWCDSTEPFTPDWNGEEKRPDDVRYEMAKESTNKYLDARLSNAYPLMHGKGIYEHQRAADPAKRVTNLTRSGYPGIQKYGAILWSGDIAATWEVFANQIREGLSMGMSGYPYWTLDAGAFFVGNQESWKRWANATEGTHPWFWHGAFEKGVEDRGYRELYTRWLQLAAFLPVMRSHGTDTPREPWQFGEKGTVYYDTIVKYINLRYRLLPYTYSLAGRVAFDNYTIMRSLMFDFAEDEKVKNIGDEFMFGSAFLVCPVTHPVEYGPDSTPLSVPKTREVYLPKGADWYDYDTGAYLKGGQTITADAPVSRIPVYVRAGSIIPVLNAYSGTAASANAYSGSGGQLSGLEVYAGADGRFTVYVDSGNGYDYEQGRYSCIPAQWVEKDKMLILGDVTGLPGLKGKMGCVLHTPGGDTYTSEIDYQGTKTAIVMKD